MILILLGNDVVTADTGVIRAAGVAFIELIASTNELGVVLHKG